MNIYLVVALTFLTTWTILSGLFLYLCLRVVRWLEAQLLSDVDGWPLVPAPRNTKAVVQASKRREPDMVRINEELDTKRAQRAATDAESVRVVGDNLFSEEELEGDDKSVIEGLKRFKKS